MIILLVIIIVAKCIYKKYYLIMTIQKYKKIKAHLKNNNIIPLTNIIKVIILHV